MSMAKDIMRKKAVTVDGESSIFELSEMLTKNNMSGLPVVDKDGTLIGFASGREIIATLNSPDLREKKVKDIMVKKVITVDVATPMEEISKIFTEKTIHAIPVVSGDKVVGVILRKAVIDNLLENYY